MSVNTKANSEGDARMFTTGTVHASNRSRRRCMASSGMALRKPTVAEAPAIAELVNRFAKKALMLPRAVADVRERIRDFTICECNGRVVGCVALHVLWEDLGEIRSLAVADPMQKHGVGSRLVEVCVREANELALARLMTLTYEKRFFKRLGFRECPKESLPQKVWKDCVNCPRFPTCDESAMVLGLKPAAHGSGRRSVGEDLGRVNGELRE